MCCCSSRRTSLALNDDRQRLSVVGLRLFSTLGNAHASRTSNISWPGSQRLSIVLPSSQGKRVCRVRRMRISWARVVAFACIAENANGPSRKRMFIVLVRECQARGKKIQRELRRRRSSNADCHCVSLECYRWRSLRAIQSSRVGQTEDDR